MEQLKSILATITADGYWDASKNLPNANDATMERMEGETKDVSGRRVIVTFRRHYFKRHQARWYAWQIDAARFVDSDADSGKENVPSSEISFGG